MLSLVLELLPEYSCSTHTVDPTHQGDTPLLYLIKEDDWFGPPPPSLHKGVPFWDSSALAVCSFTHLREHATTTTTRMHTIPYDMEKSTCIWVVPMDSAFKLTSTEACLITHCRDPTVTLPQHLVASVCSCSDTNCVLWSFLGRHEQNLFTQINYWWQTK